MNSFSMTRSPAKGSHETCSKVKRTIRLPAQPTFDRRATASLAAGLAVLTISCSSLALTPVDLKDDRKVKSTGFDIIYEARDLDLPQNVRDGLTQARNSVDDTKKRVAESKKRITKEVLPYIKKAYWTDAKEALRLQVGTLRFDLNTLAGAKPKAEKKVALAAKKQFLEDIEMVDFAIREKKMDVALKSYDTAVSSLDTVLSKVL